jgi:hypothetical protein
MRRLAPPNHINPVVSLAKVSESQETTATMLSVATHMGQAKVRKSKSGLILLTLGIGTVVGVVAGLSVPAAVGVLDSAVTACDDSGKPCSV